MINGRYDFIFPVDTNQDPMFRLFGTPLGDKRHVLFDSGHATPLTPWFRESLDWVDHYLEPRKRRTVFARHHSSFEAAPDVLQRPQA